jgi:hypothetical protein
VKNVSAWKRVDIQARQGRQNQGQQETVSQTKLGKQDAKGISQAFGGSLGSDWEIHVDSDIPLSTSCQLTGGFIALKRAQPSKA